MGNDRLPKIALTQVKMNCLKQCSCKDNMAWLKHRGINESVILQKIDNVKNIITSKFKDKFLCEKNLAFNMS